MPSVNVTAVARTVLKVAVISTGNTNESDIIRDQTENLCTVC